MTLVELHVDLARVAQALEKIVYLLEKLVYPPPPPEVPVQQATLDDLHTISPEDHQRIGEEVMAFAELHRVVPGSEAFDRELVDWEQRQRSLNGERWEAPDWVAAFTAAIRPVRESARPASARDQA